MSILKQLCFSLVVLSSLSLLSCSDSEVCRRHNGEPQYLDLLNEFKIQMEAKNDEGIAFLAEKINSKDKCSYTGKYFSAVYFALKVDKEAASFESEVDRVERLMIEAAGLAENNAFVWATLANYMQLWEMHERAIHYYEMAINDPFTPEEEAIRMSIKSASSHTKISDLDGAVSMLMRGFKLGGYSDAWVSQKIVETLAKTKNVKQLLEFWSDIRINNRVEDLPPDTKSDLCHLLKVVGAEDYRYCEAQNKIEK